jgi:hypothetical protein
MKATGARPMNMRWKNRKKKKEKKKTTNTEEITIELISTKILSWNLRSLMAASYIC